MPTAEQMGMKLPVGTDYIKEGDDAIKINAEQTAKWITDTSYKRGSVRPNMSIREQFYGAEWAGTWVCLVASVCKTLTDLPQDLIDNPRGFNITVDTMGDGVILKIRVYDVYGDAEYICNSAPSNAAGWTRWRKYLLDGDVPEPDGGGVQPSGFKTLPLILTAGRGGDESKAPLSANVEYDVNLSPAIQVSRYRFAIRDGNPRWGTSTAQAIRLSNVSVAGVQKLSAMTTNADGSITFSPWMTGPLGNLKFDYTAPQQPRYIIGGGRVNGTRRTEMPFELWLEVEVPATTPAIGLVGDSNSVGVNSTIPINDAWMSQYCRRMGYFPVLYGHSGDGMSQAQTVAHYKWNRWNHLDRPDAVVHANGANDLPDAEGGVTLSQLQAWARAEWEISDAKISKIKLGAVIKSRSSGVNDAVRVQYNKWIKSLPEPLRDWHDIASPVTANDAGGLLAQYISSDNIHMNTAGQTAIANSITHPMVPKASTLTVKQDAGRVITAWDYLNNREQLIYGDTGIREVTALSKATSGKVKLSRQGNMVWLYLEDVKVETIPDGNTAVMNLFDAYGLPSGFRPGATYWFPAAANHSGTDRRQFAVASSGWVPIYYRAANTDIYRACFVFPTPEPWPAVLPGNPA